MSDDLLTVVLHLWYGWRPLYSGEHVNAMQRMLARHLTLPHRLVVFTDMPDKIDTSKVEVLPFPEIPKVRIPPEQPNCYRRLWLFSEQARLLGRRVLSIDLDAVILRNIDHLLTDHDFRICEGMNSPYNGSMWWLKTGSRTRVWTDFNPKRSPHEANAQRQDNGTYYLGSDQAWISHKARGAATWGTAEGVFMYYKIRANTPENAAIVFFPGPTKVWDRAVQDENTRLHLEYKQYLQPERK